MSAPLTTGVRMLFRGVLSTTLVALLAVTGGSVQVDAAVLAALTPVDVAPSVAHQAGNDASSTSASDVAIDGAGDAAGYHVRKASSGDGYVWHDVAVLRPANLDPGSWYGYQCVTGDGKFAAVAVLPGDLINRNEARDHGAFAYSVNLESGAVKALGSGVGLKYHSPGCGLTGAAVFTSNPGTNETETVATAYDLSSGKQTSQSIVAGQVTSVVPLGDRVVGASGSSLVELPEGGSTDNPTTTHTIADAGAAAFDLRAATDGGADFLTDPGDGSVKIAHLKDANVSGIGAGKLGATRLFQGAGGHNLVAGADEVKDGLTALDASQLPIGAANAALDGGGVFGADTAVAPGAAGAPATQADASQAAGLPLVEVQATKQAHQTTLKSTDSAGGSSPARKAGPEVPHVKKPEDAAQPAPTEAKPAVFTKVGPTGPAFQLASNVHAIPALSSGATTPKCSVARLQPTLQAMQPGNAQVDWATQMAEQGLLTAANGYARPANFANMGLVSYAPSDDFPPIALSHPSTDTWSTVPRSVMVAIDAQESNFNQASWHALPGIAGDPLIADYYGAGDAIDTINYPAADCGYGVAQVTTGMAATDTSISAHGQMKVAVDYQENIAAGLNILEQTWNQLYAAGITANGGDPKYLENWFLATWAYNTGIQPTAAFGNTSGCTPGPTCTGPDGTWGLGWSNNPRNPDYDPNRTPYLKSTYADAAHPSSWPYEERIMGWMASPIIRYGYIAYNTPDYHGGNSWLQIPGVNTFCSTTGNKCDPTNATAGYCTLADSECWWHQPATWVTNCATTCATANYEDSAGSTEPTYTDKYPPTCNQDTSVLPSGALIVDDLSTPSQNLQGCQGMNWSNSGSFSYSPGTNSSGDPIGNIDTHQLGSGFGGHIFFTHTEPSSSSSLINTGTWTPNLPSLQYYKVKIHIPASGATATDVVYTINPGGSASPWKIRVNQDWESEQWVTIGTFAMQNGGNVQLTNASDMPAEAYDVAYDAVAFLPEGGTPGQPIGGPPGIQDAPKGSNPAWVNCGCVRRTEGDPVDTATGYFGETATDLATPGLGEALHVTRDYSAILADASGPIGSVNVVNGPFGYGWTFGYGLKSTTNADGSVTIRQEDGSAVTFNVSGSTYTPAAPRYDATLVKSGTSYLFTRHATDQFTFDTATGRLTAISDPAGRAATPSYATALGYDTSGNLHTVTDPGGRVYTFTWTGTHITKVITAAGQEVDYVYSAAGDLTDVYGVGTTRTNGVNGDQDHAQYQYNSKHLMTSERTPANYGKTSTPTPVTGMVYDASDRVTTQTDPMGNVTKFTYGPDSTAGITAGQTLVTDPVGHKNLYTYQNGLLTSMTKGWGATGASTWSYAYDPITLGVAVQTNPDGTTQTYAYDDHGRKISSSDGLGRTTSYQYDAAGNVTKTVDPTGLQTATVYNAAEKPTSVTVFTGTQPAESANDTLNPSYARASSTTYGDAAHPGEATGATNANQHTTTYAYDAFGDLITQTDAASNVTKYGYDTGHGWRTSTVTPIGVAAGITTSCTPPAKGCTTYQHDAYGHVTVTTDPLGHTVKASFDADGNQLTATDGNNHTTTTTYDNADRPIKVQKPSTDASTTTYNGDGTVQKTTDAASHATSYTYDAQARVLTSTNPDNKTTTYTYDSMGRLKTTTMPDSSVATQTWDNAGQLTGISYSGTSTPAVTYAYDRDGRRTSMTDGTGTSTYSHDVFGETTSTTNGAGATTTFGYDAVGNTTSIGYPGGGPHITRAFNTLEQLASITDANGTTNFGYNPDGAPTTTGYANGTTATVAYNDADQPTSSTLTKGATGLGTIIYARDNTGSLTGTTPTSGAPGAATTYGYNTNQYLTGATVGTTTTSYGYDKTGNPITLGTTTQVFDPAGQVCWTTTTTVTSPTCGTPATGATKYEYDANGNRTGKTPGTGTATTYGYNAAGELTTIAGAVTANYAYDGDGLRTSKTTGGTTTKYTWDNRGKVPQLLSDGTSCYVYGPTGAVVEQTNVTGGTPTSYFTDAHGSTVELTNTSGTVTGTYAYNPWGAVTAHTGAVTPFQFAGAFTDAETGLLYLIHRYYDPVTALFLSIDPLVAKTLAAYGYAGNNPLNALDPLGLWGWGDTWALVGAIGIGIGVVALAATGVGLIADAGFLTAYVGITAAETISAVSGVVALSAGTVGVGLDAAACFGGDAGGCAAATSNAIGTSIGGVGYYAGRSGYDGARSLGIGAAINSLPYSGFGFGLDVKGFIESCNRAREEDQGEPTNPGGNW
ncbi:MAG: type IV secretion protein Rhs [Actinobacteria bacterium]|nr:type IV secretion protein Rhs [Actinomycetota bacterium]